MFDVCEQILDKDNMTPIATFHQGMMFGEVCIAMSQLLLLFSSCICFVTFTEWSRLVD